MRLLGTALATLLLAGTSGTLPAQTVTGPDLRAANAVKQGVDAWTQGDYMKAVSIWRPLAMAGDPDAQFNMGQATKLGRGTPVDLPVALEWYRKAAQQGHQRAEDNYGLLLFQQNRRAEAMPYIRKSAERGEPRAQYLLGTALYNGDLAPKDWVRAYALMTRASSAGLTQATDSLATMDQYIPEPQRKKGLALATQMAQNSPSAAIIAPPPLTAPATASSTAAVAASASRPVSGPVAPRPDPEYNPMPRPAATASAPALPPVYAPSAPQAVASAPAPAPVAAVVAKPKPVPAQRPVAVAAPAGKWRIQLGAFGADDAAKKLWSSLKVKVAKLGSYQPYLVKGGNVTRLQAGPLASQADADRLCSAVKAAGADCMVKKP